MTRQTIAKIGGAIFSTLVFVGILLSIFGNFYKEPCTNVREWRECMMGFSLNNQAATATDRDAAEVECQKGLDCEM